MSDFSPYDFLNRKRRGDDVTAGEVGRFVSAFMSGEVADYQMSAYLMATAIQGAADEELAALTNAMLESGEQWNLRDRFDFIADKHSTGGVGDKVSISLTPLVASCGVAIGMLSGRGLGHTGGTLDKLESIPGFRAVLSREEFERCVETVGGVIATSTANVAPADRRMYALRDVTGTVESIPLITASIMSKKLATGATALLLDVKTGRGAFMPRIEQSRALARSLIAAARGSGTKVEALITDMDQPLGRAVGNALEIAEAIDMLRGDAPDDLTEVTIAQAERILVLSGQHDGTSAREAIREAIGSGRALAHAAKWIEAQGGDPRIVDDQSLLPSSSEIVPVRATAGGLIEAIDAYGVGILAGDLGAGRMRAEDPIDPRVGIIFRCKVGDEVSRGDVMAEIHLGEKGERGAVERLQSLVTIGEQRPAPRPLVHELLEEDDR